MCVPLSFLCVALLFNAGNSGCVKLTMDRIGITKTLGESGTKQHWEVNAPYIISVSSNFASRDWNSCTQTYSGGFPNVYGEECTPPAGTSSDDGFYNCYLSMGAIYLSEYEYVNFGFEVEEDGQVGDIDDGVEFGPIWSYTFNWKTERSASWSLADVQSGVQENWATRCGPSCTNSPLARHFFRQEWVDDCTFNADEFQQCGTYSDSMFSGLEVTTIAGSFPGSQLFVRGFNLFTATASGSPLLDIDFLIDDTETYTTEGSTCSFSSLEFSSMFNSFSEFAESDSQSLALQFSASSTGAGGSLSTTRTESRRYSKTAQTFIFSLDLECIAARASIVNFNKLHWNAYFVDEFAILPHSYVSGDDLEDYIEFWDTFGTHIVESAELGGMVHGAVVVDKCSALQEFSTSTEFQACLNAMYKGIEVEGCGGTGESTTLSSAVSSSVSNAQIDVFGGSSSTYSQIFSDLSGGAHETDFYAWISGLRSAPFIIGGNIDEIHDAIIKAVRLGDHNLNAHRLLANASTIDDDTLLLIAEAMKAAYADYSSDLVASNNFFEVDECSIQCAAGSLDSSECECSCITPEECCFGANAALLCSTRLHWKVAFALLSYNFVM